jgi:hypothetical protein
MRRFDKKHNIQKANLLSEQRYLESKGLIKETIEEEYFDSRKEVEGYVDAEELVGKLLWFHTNRTHRNQGKNGMVGVYSVDKKGNRGEASKIYTNEVRIQSPIHFQTSESGSERIRTSQEKEGGAGTRTLVAGVSGVVVPTDSGNTGGMELANFNPFDSSAPWFYLNNDGEKKEIISADEVYFYADEAGQWYFYVKNAQFSGKKGYDVETKEEPSLAAELNEAGGNSPYFETLSQALDAVREYAEKLGLEVDEHDMWFQFGTGGVGYEESKSANIGLLKNGEPMLDKREKELNRFIHVSIYRMPSGKYELTMYKTF